MSPRPTLLAVHDCNVSAEKAIAIADMIRTIFLIIFTFGIVRNEILFRKNIVFISGHCMTTGTHSTH